MLISKDNINDYIPQRPPFVMIDSLVSATSTNVVSRFTVLQNNILSENGLFSEAGLIENIAQTAAAHVGFMSVANNTPVPIGYIASIKSLQLSCVPPVGATITSTVQIIDSIMNITRCKGEIVYNEQVICSCELRIFINKT